MVAPLGDGLAEARDRALLLFGFAHGPQVRAIHRVFLDAVAQRGGVGDVAAEPLATELGKPTST